MSTDPILICPRELIDSWFIVLEQHGFTVAVKPDTPKESFAGLGPIAYRTATVTKQEATVTIYTHPGQHPDVGTPLAGKFVVMLTYQTWPQHHRVANSALAERITKVLVEAGMTIHPATKEVLA